MKNCANRPLRSTCIFWAIGAVFIWLSTACSQQNYLGVVVPVPLSDLQNVVVAPSTTLNPTYPQPSPSTTPTPGHTQTPQPPKTISATPTALVIAPRATVIGYSVLGQPLEIYRFGYGYEEYLVIFGIHGGYEWNTIALADQLIAYLSEHPTFIPPQKRLFLLRAFNPDGEIRSAGYAGRANENGVDLNRNFPIGWKDDWDRRGCWDHLPITAGTRPFSEPETQALRNFVASRQIKAIISYHSAALGIFPGGEPPDPNSIQLAEAVAQVSTYPYPPINTGCEINGSLVDWAVSENIAALDIELTNHTDTDFEQTLRILEVLLNWAP